MYTVVNVKSPNNDSKYFIPILSTAQKNNNWYPMKKLNIIVRIKQLTAYILIMKANSSQYYQLHRKITTDTE